MSFQSVQITQEEASKYVDYGRRQAQAEAPVAGISVAANQGYMSMNTQGGEVVQHNVHQMSSESFKTDGIVGSLGWEPQSPKAIVTAHGIQMTLEDAFQHGLVGKDSSGRYHDLDGSKKAR